MRLGEVREEHCGKEKLSLCLCFHLSILKDVDSDPILCIRNVLSILKKCFFQAASLRV